VKTCIPLLFVLVNLSAFSQYKDGYYAETNNPFTQNTFKTYGYINKVRLDSIAATYATITIGADYFRFDYGQQFKKNKELTVKDRSGHDLTFENNTLAVALNFADYNGWDLIKVYDGTIVTSSFLLKKKSP